MKVESIRVDGNDVCAVFVAAQAAIKRARDRKGPTLIECRTYRLRQHVGCAYDHLTGCRPEDELQEWLKRCPIQRLETYLLRRGFTDRFLVRRIRSSIVREIENALVFARRSPFPKHAQLLTHVY